MTFQILWLPMSIIFKGSHIVICSGTLVGNILVKQNYYQLALFRGFLKYNILIILCRSKRGAGAVVTNEG